MWERTPKKKSLWALDCKGDSEAWGLEAGYQISFMHVATYHVIMIAAALGFWAYWMAKNPGSKMESGAVPLTIVLGLLSAFWTGIGVLRLPGEIAERHAVVVNAPSGTP